MSNILKTILMAICVFGCVSAVSAQVDLNSEIKTRVPFEFMAGTKVMPAGEYTVSRVRSGSGLIIRNAKGDGVIVNTMPSYLVDTPKATSIEFEKIDGVYVMSQVRVSGSFTATELIKSDVTKMSLAKKAGSADSGSSTIN
jgi:hypothetical protein